MNQTTRHYDPAMTEAEEFAATKDMTPAQEREFYQLDNPTVWHPADTPTAAVNVSSELRSVFSVRFSAAELDEVRAHAETRGQKTGAYVRQLVLADVRGTSGEDDVTSDVVKVILHIARATPALDIPMLNRRLRALPAPGRKSLPPAAGAGTGRDISGEKPVLAPRTRTSKTASRKRSGDN